MMSSDFNKFAVICNIEFVCENLTPLSIGTGRAPFGAVDNPVIKREGVPYIPASSIKGILRSEAERYARTAFGVGGVCDILNPKGSEGELKLKEEKKEEYRPCLVCRVFGGPTYASHIYIYDAYPLNNNYSFEVRRRVSINRVTGGQHAARLFDVEAVNPGCKWSLKIKLENIDIFDGSEEAKLLTYLFSLMVNDGIMVGGKRSIGFGLLKVTPKSANKLWLKDGKLESVDVTEPFIKLLKG